MNDNVNRPVFDKHAIYACFVVAALVAMGVKGEIVLVSPIEGESVALLQDAQKQILAIDAKEGRKAAIDDMADRNRVKWRQAKNLVLKWRTTEGESGPWKIEIGKDPEFENADVRYVSVKSSDLATENCGADGVITAWMMPRANLEIAQNYCWRVTGMGNQNAKGERYPCVRSETSSFVTEDCAPRWIEIEGNVKNIRDIGGWRTVDGRRVRQGMAFRGQGLNGNSVTGERQGRNRLTVEDVKYLAGALGIRTDLDLRGKGETADLSESPLGPGVKFFNNSACNYEGIFTRQGMEVMAKNFRVFCDKGNYPIYFHCIAGADRTGSLAYVLNGLLGVPRASLEKDWELTFYPKIPDMEKKGGWRNTAAFDKGFGKYGGDGAALKDRIELYLLDCGVTADEIAEFRSIMLE